MEHYKSRNNDFFHFTNPHDDVSELDDEDYDELQYYDVDDDRSCDFSFHAFSPLGITPSPLPNFQTNGLMDQNGTVTTSSVEELRTFDNGALIFQLDNIMKNLSDNLQNRIEGIDTRISRLGDETCKLDKYVEDVKDSAERHHGTTHRKLRQMQSILQEVQDGVLFLRDKHEIAETRLQLAKLQGSKRDKINVAQTNPKQPLPIPAPQSSCHIPFTDLNKHSSNAVTFSKAVSFHPAVSQAPEITVQQSQMPHQNKADPHFPHFTQSYVLNPFQGVVSPQNHPYLSHPHQETPNRPSDSYSPSAHHFPSETARWGSTHEHEGGLPHSRNYKSEFHANYIPEFASFSNIHPHCELPSSHEIPNVKPVEFSLHPQEESSRSNYQHIPLAQALPHALPTASDVEDGSSSEEIPVDEIVDKVTAMGFRRDLVRANVRKLTENGSSVDLNAVLDRMMNNK
ncbi:hypothetical protein L6452_07216 [Arctium lappa]|uniref:Uncharacterized protein n=1 Tax=Arctium lappa TaxID=4217 RepID=A0ACB9EL14_ARCLA|nr:hypothetical protein L6452_07216 [Arctium lappa]